MPETCEKWLDLVIICIYYAPQTREIGQVLPYSLDFKAPGELWNPLCKTILKCSFNKQFSNEGSVNIWNDRKARK